MRFLFLLIVACGASALGTAQQTPQEQPTFRAETAIVRVDAQVHEGKRLVSDLSRGDFVVSDDGVPQGQGVRRRTIFIPRCGSPPWGIHRNPKSPSH